MSASVTFRRSGGAWVDVPARCAEMLLALARDPQRRRLAIIGRGRIGIFRRQPVFDRHAAKAGDIGDALEQRIVLIRCADRPAATVNVKIEAARVLRRDDAQLHRTGGPGDRHRLGARRFRRGRKRADARNAPRTDFRDRQAGGLGIEPAHDLVVDGAGLGGNRGWVEQGGIDEKGVGHGLCDRFDYRTLPRAATGYTASILPFRAA